MFRVSLLLPFVLMCTNTWAQLQGRGRLDSLVNAIEQCADDTSRIRTLYMAAFAYRVFSPDTGIMLATQALGEARKSRWQEGIYEATRTIGVNHSQKGDHETALRIFNDILEMRGDHADRQRGGMLVNIMLIHFHRDEHDRAIDIGLQALKECERIDNSACLAASHSNLGLIYNAIGEHEKSILHHSHALEIHRKRKNKDGEARAIGNIGLVYQELKRYPEALDQTKQALEIYAAIGQNKGMAINHANAGSILADMDSLAEAYPHTSMAIDLSGQLNDLQLKGITQCNLGDLYLKAAKIDGPREALPPFDVAVEIRLNKAADLLEEGLRTLEPTGHLAARKNALASLAEVEALRGRWKQAYENSIRAGVVKDSILSQDKLVQISRLETQRERELREKDGEIQALHLQEARTEKQYFSGALILVLLFSVGLLYHHRTRRRKDRQLIQMKEELLQREKDLFTKQRLELEVKALRAQMNPHFIFNCLNSIQAMILDEKKEVATEYLQKFSKLIRLILDNARKDTTTLEDEAEILTLYLDLEKLRMSNGFEYEISIPDDVEAAFTEFPSMVIQPLVENSIWHGLMPAQRQGHLRISFRRDHDHLTCVVEDNGIGRDLSRRMKNTDGHDSKGLQLIQERLQAWSRTRHTECNVFVQNVNEDGSGTRTEISIHYPSVMPERKVAAVA